jgi:type I restriction enzyme R subunit
MKEDHLESVCLDWLGELGWTCAHGDDVSPGGAQCDRAKYSDVVLASRLRDAAARLNPELTATEVDEVVDKLSAYGAQSLVDGNKEVYDWLRNGVPVQRIETDGRRTVLRNQS